MNYSLRKYPLYKRLFDIIFSFIGLILFALPLLIFVIMIKIISKGPVLHWSDRVGINNSHFKMAKLRTMKNGTPVLSSNHFKKPDRYFIPLGKVFREFGFDELPQLYNILRGDMSFVGPRPVILDDYETINLRNEKMVNSIKPGLTGLAQINGRNDTTIPEKVRFDEIYMQNMSISLDIKIIILTNYYMICENIFRRNILGLNLTKIQHNLQN
jgi:O-antigen biosynthesis protein WbqP